MTNTVRNVLLAIAILIFGGAAVRDGLRHDARSTLEDVFIGSMVCLVVLRVSKLPKRRTSTEPR